MVKWLKSNAPFVSENRLTRRVNENSIVSKCFSHVKGCHHCHLKRHIVYENRRFCRSHSPTFTNTYTHTFIFQFLVRHPQNKLPELHINPCTRSSFYTNYYYSQKSGPKTKYLSFVSFTYYDAIIIIIIKMGKIIEKSQNQEP